MTTARELPLLRLILLLLRPRLILTRRLISCSVVVECDATSAAAFSQAKETRRAKDSTELIRARRVSVQLERPASGTPGSGAEAESASSENVSPPRSSLAPSTILSFPPPPALQETSQRLRHPLGSPPACAHQTSATPTSARRRGESCRGRPQPADRLQGGQRGEQRPGEQQQRDEQLGLRSLQNNHEGRQDCLATDRISIQTLLDCSATPVAPFSTQTRNAISLTGRRSPKCKPVSQTRPA